MMMMLLLQKTYGIVGTVDAADAVAAAAAADDALLVDGDLLNWFLKCIADYI